MKSYINSWPRSYRPSNRNWVYRPRAGPAASPGSLLETQLLKPRPSQLHTVQQLVSLAGARELLALLRILSCTEWMPGPLPRDSGVQPWPLAFFKASFVMLMHRKDGEASAMSFSCCLPQPSPQELEQAPSYSQLHPRSALSYSSGAFS